MHRRGENDQADQLAMAISGAIAMERTSSCFVVALDARDRPAFATSSITNGRPVAMAPASIPPSGIWSTCVGSSRSAAARMSALSLRVATGRTAPLGSTSAHRQLSAQAGTRMSVERLERRVQRRRVAERPAPPRTKAGRAEPGRRPRGRPRPLGDERRAAALEGRGAHLRAPVAADGDVVHRLAGEHGPDRLDLGGVSTIRDGDRLDRVALHLVALTPAESQRSLVDLRDAAVRVDEDERLPGRVEHAAQAGEHDFVCCVIHVSRFDPPLRDWLSCRSGSQPLRQPDFQTGDGRSFEGDAVIRRTASRCAVKRMLPPSSTTLPSTLNYAPFATSSTTSSARA